MNINLPIRHINIFEKHSKQKCILPQKSFPINVLPGSVAKCNEFICQIYSKNFISDICYMDDCCIEYYNNSLLHENSKVLTKLVILKKRQASAINLIIEITENFLLNCSEKITNEYIKNITLPVLWSLKLVSHCTIRTSKLKNIGIQSIEVSSNQEHNQDVYFVITEMTNLNVLDIRLKNILLKEVNYYSHGFQTVDEALQNIFNMSMKTAEMKSKRYLGPSANVLISGPSGCGKSCLVFEFIKKNNCNYFIITNNLLQRQQYPGQAEYTIRGIFEAVNKFISLKPKLPTIICFENIQLLCPVIKRSSTNDATGLMRIIGEVAYQLDEVFRSKNEILCVATTPSLEEVNPILRCAGRFQHELSIKMLTKKERYHLIESFIKHSKLLQNLNKVFLKEFECLCETIAKCTQGFVIADIIKFFKKFEKCLIYTDNVEMLAMAKKCLMEVKPASTINADISVIKSNQGFNVVGGMNDLKRLLEVTILAAFQQHKIFHKFGLHLPKGILLYGPPGCAKTTFAKCLAHEANMSFIAVSSAEVYSPYVGCAEKFISKIFDIARKHSPCLIFLDEIDSLVGRRDGSSADVQTRILSTLLTELDGIIDNLKNGFKDKQILVIAATNRPEMVDGALMRPGRFDKLIHVPAPDYESRISILKLRTKNMPLAADVSLDNIAINTNNFSGADICNICNEAAYKALSRNFNTDEITDDDFEYALQANQSSLSEEIINKYYDFESKFVK
ncbi:cell division control protein 48 homolog A [Teleopsis dalmanni]|uniref:cell division control protein 48 homolog A n=1 Tax=Teleopsis dalmanni TaxID=139649 RepID=UPI0018CDDC23|nr:cell division control protein 48 homolog A [Teleopsis dalmanni]